MTGESLVPNTITLTNAHGTFTVDADVLARAVFRLGAATVSYLRCQTAKHCGYPEPDTGWLGFTALDDCNAVECLIMWVESGNHTF